MMSLSINLNSSASTFSADFTWLFIYVSSSVNYFVKARFARYVVSYCSFITSMCSRCYMAISFNCFSIFLAESSTRPLEPWSFFSYNFCFKFYINSLTYFVSSSCCLIMRFSSAIWEVNSESSWFTVSILMSAILCCISRARRSLSYLALACLMTSTYSFSFCNSSFSYFNFANSFSISEYFIFNCSYYCINSLSTAPSPVVSSYTSATVSCNPFPLSSVLRSKLS